MKPRVAHFILSRSITIANPAKKHSEKIRFLLVGGLNTAIDFVIFFTLTSLGLSSLISNYTSTSIALIFSFFANKKFTFKDNTADSRVQFIKFLTITLIGLWIIQPIIIEGAQYIAKPTIAHDFIALLIGKSLATVVTMIWNYLLYKKLVFGKK